MSLTEAAELMGVTTSGLRKRARRKNIPSIKIGERWLISRAWVHDQTAWAVELIANHIAEGKPIPTETMGQERRIGTVTIEGYRLKPIIRAHCERMHGPGTKEARDAQRKFECPDSFTIPRPKDVRK